MEEWSLRVFLSLCETENTRETAAVLRVEQSTVSRTLARLESDLHVPLFDRRGRRLLLNARGVGFRADARRILETIESARRHAAAGDGADIVRIGHVPSVGRWLLPEVVTAHRRVLPASRFELRAEFARELFRLLRDDVIDVALTTAPRTDQSELAWQLLHEERLGLAVPPEHRLARRRRVDVTEIAHEPFVAFTHDTELRGVVDGLLQRSGVRVDVTVESGELDTVRGLVSAGLGLAILPAAAPYGGGLETIALTPRTVRPVGIAWRDPGRRSTSAERFLQVARDRADGERRG